MFDLINEKNYSDVCNIVLLVITMLTYLHCSMFSIDHKKNLNYLKNMRWILFLFMLFYMGFRPIIEEGDTATYCAQFRAAQEGEFSNKDILFSLLVYAIAQVSTQTVFFFACTVIYIVPLLLASKKWSGEYALYLFLGFILTFSFWAYGTNTIRSGMAGSIFILALATDRKLIKYALFLGAIGFHQSLLLPVLGYFVVMKNFKTSFFIKVWLAAIGLAITLGGVLNNFLLNIGFLEDRLDPYMLEASDSFVEGYEMGFRWDFLTYSAIPVLYALFMIYKKNFNDSFYKQILALYLLMNSFWILIIRVPYSDRFAYLSWLLIPLLIVYPLLKEDTSRKNIVVGNVLLCMYLVMILIS